MTNYFQIIATTDTGANLIWDEFKSDFVDFSKEVPYMTADEYPEEWQQAKEKAKQYMGISEIFIEELDSETAELRGIVLTLKL